MRKRNELGLATIGALCDGVQIGREDQGASLAALRGPWRGGAAGFVWVVLHGGDESGASGAQSTV
jgi:hypothetical protein